ncbi:MAG: hypothetical protein K0U76_17225 [Actinomycetia bacterium]|nr:hypothetical protein [Actinomycetes bacterium]MCH9703091.1 hypothetical protein [Actinomycetes bacterium]MCH9734963.1 hypothetical protein [Actinomycetes bacterium]
MLSRDDPLEPGHHVQDLLDYLNDRIEAQMTTDDAEPRYFKIQETESGRLCWLAAVTHIEDRWSTAVFGYVPDLEAFVYNDPLTVDVQVDDELGLEYLPITAEEAAAMIRSGELRRFEGHADYLLAKFREEPRKLPPPAAAP